MCTVVCVVHTRSNTDTHTLRQHTLSHTHTVTHTHKHTHTHTIAKVREETESLEKVYPRASGT